MDNFHQLLSSILHDGDIQYNQRTGLGCHVKVGEQIEFNLADGFPAITSKKLWFASSSSELLGFFRGYDSADQFRALGSKIWDKNANETQAWLDNPYRKGIDHLGPIYGVQWTKWRDTRIVDSLEEKSRLLTNGYQIDVADEINKKWAMTRYINQLEKVLHTLITNPSDRRMIVSGWNVAELDMMALPPCHMDYRFVAFEETKKLSVVMTIRSWDTFLGGPFNISNTALFLSLMARLSGYTPDKVVIQATNAHIYENHESQVKEQLSRTYFALPKLIISDRVQPVTLETIKGAFERIEPDDFWLEGYQSHDAIKAEMAA